MSDLPVGGTPGLCHESSASVEEAARWWLENAEAHRSCAVATLRSRFGLSAKEACQAFGLADKMRAGVVN